MTILASKFTPEVLLAAPRRSNGTPSSDGTLVLYSVSTYSFEKQEKLNEIRVLDVLRNESQLITDSKTASNAKWLTDQTIALLESESGATKIVVGNIKNFGQTKYTVGTVNSAVSDWKIKSNGKDKLWIALAAATGPDGRLYNAEQASKSPSTGRLYSSTMVRHWDTWTTPIKNSIWISHLSGLFNDLKLGELINALKGTKLECPIPPFGSSGDFDISEKHFAFVTKDPAVPKGFNTKQNLYIAELSDPTKNVKQIEVKGLDGAISTPSFSPNGKFVAFLSMRLNGYESDKNQIVIQSLQKGGKQSILYATDDHVGAWDRSPSSITWSQECTELYVLASDDARVKVFKILLDMEKLEAKDFPEVIHSSGSVSDVTLVKSGLFLTSSSLVDNSTYSLLLETGVHRLLSSNSLSGAKFGLSNERISEIHFPGASPDTRIQAWVVKPSDFDKARKYPLAYLIHGGPQGAWEDSWSTRWNPAIFAEQGYVVVTPNPTASTGFGQKFVDDIQKQWGGLPYHDLVLGFEYIEKKLDYVDTSKAVALGASYGGYMMNWIQGNDLGRKFKALVTHDGVFNITAQLSTEEVYFPEREFGGVFWENKEEWQKWDPASKTENWQTPQLIIHSEKDYRLTIAEGLAAFNVLQRRGIESQFLTFPDENHWVLKPENSLLWHTVVLDFINPKVGLLEYSKQSSRAKELKEQAWSD